MCAAARAPRHPARALRGTPTACELAARRHARPLPRCLTATPTTASLAPRAPGVMHAADEIAVEFEGGHLVRVKQKAGGTRGHTLHAPPPAPT